MRLKTISRPYTRNILCYKRCSIVQILSNKQSVKVICRFDRLRQHTARDKKPCENWKGYWPPIHLNYIVLRARTNTDLTSCEDFATTLTTKEKRGFKCSIHTVISVNFIFMLSGMRK